MTPFDENHSSTLPGAPSTEAVTTKTPDRAAPIPVSDITAEAPAPPALRRAPRPEGNPGVLQWTLLALVAGLGFLLASFPAKSTDLWAHLAHGRSFAQQGLFAASNPDNHSWLFDLACYELYGILGGTGLVILKALLIGALAVVMLRVAAVSRNWWIPIFCTSLALLTLGIRLGLNPAAVSCLFLGLTLWWLRPRENESGHVLPRWPVLVLFVLWANTDGWFLLGLAVFALVEIGRILDGRTSLKALAGVALAMALCLLNPRHFHVFEVLSDVPWIGEGGATLRNWPQYFRSQGFTPAGLAYFPLLLVGLASFSLDAPRIRWERFLPWITLAVLSALDVRVVPFFAVVAGPTMAWNLIDLAKRRENEETFQNSIGWGHALTVLVTLVLVVSAWPGWLQIPPYEPRRWGVETSPSLESGAQVMRQWIKDGKLKIEAGGLHVSKDSVDAFAWFCPEEKSILNEGLAKAIRGQADAPPDWAKQMHDRGINHVVLYDADPDRLFAALGNLLADPRQWPLLFVEGSMAVFGWRDPAVPGDPFHGWQLDLERLAFLEPAEKIAAAPASDSELEAREWFEAFWKPIPPRPKDLEEANLHLKHAEAMRLAAPRRHEIAWQRLQATSLLGAANGWAGPQDVFDAYMRLTFVDPQVPADQTQFTSVPAADRLANALKGMFVMQQDDIPPALIYLAIRSARRAIAVNPEDAQAYLVLGESYMRLIHATRERLWMEQFPELQQLRRAQASAALNKAVKLKPDFAQAHFSLSGLYGDMQYYDLMLEHRNRFFDLKRREAPPAGADPEEYRERLADFEDGLKNLSREVEKRQAHYEIATAHYGLFEKAAFSTREEKLAGQALKMLLDSDISYFGTNGMKLEVELLLRTGRPEAVRDWTGPEHQVMLSGPSYFWEKIQAYAALGDYTAARKSCDDWSRSLGMGPGVSTPVELRRAMSSMISERVQSEFSGMNSIINLTLQAYDRTEFLNRISFSSKALRRQADVIVLRGLIALEEGAVKDAEVAFREALSFWKDEKTAASGGGLDFNGRITAQTYLEWMR